MKFMLKKTLKININKYFVRQRSYPLVHILQSQMQDFRLSDDLYHESDSSISSAEFLPNNTIPFLHNLRSENTDILNKLKTKPETAKRRHRTSHENKEA